MCAVANKPKPRSLCPSCYDAGLEVDLPFSGRMYACANGHQFEDIEALAKIVLEMNQKRATAEAKRVDDNPAPVITFMPPVEDGRIKIDDIDRQRIASIIGDFGDSATLFGNLFALNEQMKDMREKIQRAEDRIALSQVRKLGGDYSITVHIPERHVQPIKDIADSGGMSVDRYMQAKLEEGLDNLWYY